MADTSVCKKFYPDTEPDKLIRLSGVPDSADVSVYQDYAVISLRKDWGDSTDKENADFFYPGGSLLVVPLKKLIDVAGEVLPTFKADSLPEVTEENDYYKENFVNNGKTLQLRKMCKMLFKGGVEGEALQDTCETKNYLIIHKTVNLKPELEFWKKGKNADGTTGKTPSEVDWVLDTSEKTNFLKTTTSGGGKNDAADNNVFESISLSTAKVSGSGRVHVCHACLA